MSSRSTEDVFMEHLQLALQVDIQTDLDRNFSTHCVLLTSYGVFRGHDGVRAAAALLERQIGRTSYEDRTTLIEGDVGFLEWTAESERGSKTLRTYFSCARAKST